MHRRDFLKHSAAAALLAANCHAASFQTESPSRPDTGLRPNILLILADDHGAETGLLGTPQLHTPNLDRIGRSGLFFTQAFVATAPCSPSRTSLLTGRYPHQHNVRYNTYEYFGPDPVFNPLQLRHDRPMELPDDVPTLIELLKQARYRTGITSKFHMISHHRFPFDAWYKPEVDQVGQFIRDCGDTPWFMLVNIRSPHRNFNGFQQGPLPDTRKVQLPDFLPDTPVIREDWAHYLRAVQRTDNCVGQVLDALEHSGSQDNTIVIYLGDHGPAYHRAKGSPYRFGLQTPLVVMGPPSCIVPRTEPVTHRVSSLDIMPTILDYAHAAIPSGLPGRSLRPVFQNHPGAAGHPWLIGEIHHGVADPQIAMQERTVYDGRYRLIARDHLDRPYPEPADNTSPKWGNRIYQEIVNRQDEFPREFRLLAEHTSVFPRFPAPQFEFYDCRNDRYEINNLYNLPEYHTRITRLKKILRQWMIDSDDRYFDADLLM